MDTNKVWLVTGASKGLGLALVNRLIEQGYKVAGTSRTLASLEKISNAENFLPLEMDILNEENVHRGVEAIIKKFGKIDVLVNNAGYGQLGTLEELSDKEARENFDANVFGSLNVIRQVMPWMRIQKSGHILNVASIGGLLGTFPGWGVYCATKFAVAGFTEALASEAGEFGIYATVVYPGYFRTNFLESGSLKTPANPINDYTAARELELKHEKEIAGNQPGNPELAAEAFIVLGNMQNPPLHFVMGSDAYGMAEMKLKMLQSDLTSNESLSKSTDY
ncbi:MAG: family NAD(P)-dependent oxidoreductase [Fluviicola sp.]|jgi:NAD(P)-dependent dehydrogenase (short-subunit alcohol dehydrogenase family)|uniref:SDR family NAD(P)-dependent oxidoreductase n=1 Tax=Fluviicola sp. TaxID=1917219 RepID=UPI0026273668|nr:SDR family NAD(P)-dependent oxidoreductase [Fluviicola sp.]MDF3026015.1 family NAD(P)-dependent oxidoreductase [Fluviicola sp.]